MSMIYLPYDVTSLTFVQDFYVGNLDIGTFGIEFCNGGTRLLIVRLEVTSP